MSVANDYCAALGTNNLFLYGPRLNFGNLCIYVDQSTYEQLRMTLCLYLWKNRMY